MTLWGLKTIATFDPWSIEHLASGISVGAFVRARAARAAALWVLFLAYAWETLEHYLETGLAGARVTYWFQGVEHWSNRLLSDPALMLIGLMVAVRYPGTVPYARTFSLLWLIVHVFVLKHSMALYEGL